MGTSKPQTWGSACDGGVEWVTGFRGLFTHGEAIGHLPPPPNRVDVESVGKTPGPRLGGYALRCEAGYDVHIRG